MVDNCTRTPRQIQFGEFSLAFRVKAVPDMLRSYRSHKHYEGFLRMLEFSLKHVVSIFLSELGEFSNTALPKTDALVAGRQV